MKFSLLKKFREALTERIDYVFNQILIQFENTKFSACRSLHIDEDTIMSSNHHFDQNLIKSLITLKSEKRVWYYSIAHSFKHFMVSLLTGRQQIQHFHC